MNRSPMQRGPGPQRRTGLARGAAPQRHTPLKRPTAPIATRRPAKPGERAAEDHARDLLRVRSGGWCEMRVDGACRGRGVEYSHRWAEGQGGQWTASNGLWSCGLAGCHGWTHRNPDAAKALGWLIAPAYRDGRPVSTVLFPARICLPASAEPVWVWLDDDGDWARLTADEIAAWTGEVSA